MAQAEISQPVVTTEVAIKALQAALDDVHAIGLLGVDGEELEAFTAGLLHAAERLAAGVAAAVSECDAVRLALRRGSVASTTGYLAAFTHGPTAAIAPKRTNGTWLNDFPELADAWARGSLTEAHVSELRKIDNPRVHQLLIRDQHLHVIAAETLGFSDWLNHLAYWLLHADPDGSLPRDRNNSYGLRFRTDRRGDVHVTGTLDPLAGEALQTMVEHEAKAIRRAEVSAGLEAHEQTPSRQRHLLALMQLCSRGFQRADGSWPLPLVNIVMSQKVAEDLIDRMLDGENHDPFSLPLDHHDVDRRCETIRGTPLDPRRAWPALLVGRLRRQILDAESRTIDLGRDTRWFTAVQKQALLVEARGQCTTRGCDSPFASLQADHRQPWIHGGLTDLDAGQIKCEPCNLRKGDRPEGNGR